MKEYPKLIAVFPGILVPVNSREEENKVRRNDFMAVAIGFGVLSAFTILFALIVAWKVCSL